MYYRSFQVRNVLKMIAVFTHFFMSPMYVTRIWININNIIPIHFDNEPKVS